MLPNPLATRVQLTATPSSVHGVAYGVEMELRALGCQIIQQIGELLQLPQRTMAVAQVFFQRFWFTSSMCDFSASEIAAGTVLLAAKLEETQISLRHLVNAYHYVLSCLTQGISSHPSPKGSMAPAYRPPAYDSAELQDIRDAVVVSEMQVLKRLGFHVQVMLPYALLVNYLQVLDLTDAKLKFAINPHPACFHASSAQHMDYVGSERVSLAQCAWSFLNDALQTPVLCIFGPHIVACAAIALAAEMCIPQVQLPLEPAPWWMLFDASEPEIKIAASHILWRCYHETSRTNLTELLDRHELQRYVSELTMRRK